MSKTWFCEEDEAPIPEGEGVEIKLRSDFGNEKPTIGYEVLCEHHAIKRGYLMDNKGEWRTLNANTEYLVEAL